MATSVMEHIEISNQANEQTFPAAPALLAECTKLVSNAENVLRNTPPSNISAVPISCKICNEKESDVKDQSIDEQSSNIIKPVPLECEALLPPRGDSEELSSAPSSQSSDVRVNDPYSAKVIGELSLLFQEPFQRAAMYKQAAHATLMFNLQQDVSFRPTSSSAQRKQEDASLTIMPPMGCTQQEWVSLIHNSNAAMLQQGGPYSSSTMGIRKHSYGTLSSCEDGTCSPVDVLAESINSVGPSNTTSLNPTPLSGHASLSSPAKTSSGNLRTPPSQRRLVGSYLQQQTQNQSNMGPNSPLQDFSQRPPTYSSTIGNCSPMTPSAPQIFPPVSPNGSVPSSPSVPNVTGFTTVTKTKITRVYHNGRPVPMRLQNAAKDQTEESIPEEQHPVASIEAI